MLETYLGHGYVRRRWLLARLFAALEVGDQGGDVVE